VARLTDVFCPSCGAELLDVWLCMDETPPSCPSCGAPMAIKCTGGLKSRARVCDFPPEHDAYWDGQIASYGAELCDADGNPVEHRRRDGTPIRLDQERSRERRDRARAESHRLTGRTPITIDLKRGAA